MIEPGSYFITGKMGSGKSAYAVKYIFMHLQAGRKVATNLDIKLKPIHYQRGYHKLLVRIPDKPKARDIEAAGPAYPGATLDEDGNFMGEYDESKFGLMVFDECASWFNSRTWADPDRLSLIEILVHMRKMGWNQFYLVQAFSVVDNQAKELFGEYIQHCYSSKKIIILRMLPFKFHLATLYSVMENGKTKCATFFYNPKVLYDLYESRQKFSMLYDKAAYTPLPPLNLEPFINYDWKRFLKQWWFRWVPALAGGCRYIPLEGQQ